MLSTDREIFSETMINCFQNFRAAISSALVNEWFEELQEFDFFHIRNAFKTYVRENEKFPPTLATIIRLSKKTKFEKNENSSGKQKCYVANCESEADERRGENVWMCGKHSDDWILKTQPDSLTAEILRRAKKFEEEAKAAGMSNYEYFKHSNPKGFEKFKNMVGSKTKINSSDDLFGSTRTSGISQRAIVPPQENLVGNLGFNDGVSGENV